MSSRHTLAAALLLAALLAPSPARAGEPAEPSVMFHGNIVFIEAVLLGQMGVDTARPVGQPEMVGAIKRLTTFYQKSGYSLVEIRYKKRGGAWHVFIDEGRLERIIIFGAGSVHTVLIRQALNLPGKVFNETQLVSAIARAKARYGIPRIDWKVVPIEEVEHERFQLPEWMLGGEEISRLFPFDLKPRYNLYVHVRSNEWGTGLGWGLDYNAVGLVASMDYSGANLLLNKDRERITVGIGGAHRTYIDKPTSDYYTFSHGAIGFDYYLPPLGWAWFRPHLKSDGQLSKYQRRDVPLEAYWLFREELSLNAGFEIIGGLMVSAGAGSQFNNIFGVELVPGLPVKATEGPFQRWFTSATVEMVFDEPLQRRDFEHRVKAEVRYYFKGSAEMGAVTVAYQKVFLFGFDELALRSEGVWLWGDPVFHDEYPLSWGPIHNGFSDRYYVRKAAWQTLDYGLSLYQEVITLHAFADGALYNRMDYRAGTGEIGAAFAAGPGLSMLLYDAFMFRLYYAYGRTNLGDGGWELSMSLRKVY